MRVVLLGAAGTGTAFAIAARLKARWIDRIKLILTDIYDEKLVTTSIFSDKFYKVPPAYDNNFEKVIIEIILNEKVDTYIPILNDELILASKLMVDVRFTNVDIWSSESHAKCTNKDYADDWLNRIGVPTPKRFDFNKVSESVGSWLAKPRNGFGSKDVKTLSAEDIKQLSKEYFDNFIVQEMCENPEVTVDSFYDSIKGEGYAYCRERIETKSGVCTKARLFYDSQLIDFAKKIGVALEQRGTICFQVMRGATGWVVTDLNLRSGAGTAMTCAAGYDVLSAAYACRIGEDYSLFLKPMKQSEEFYITRQYSEFVMRHTE